SFFSVFTNRTDLNVHLGYWVDLGLVPGDAYDFELLHANRTNWTLTVNGAYFGGAAANATFDFNATMATWLGGIGFSEVALYDSTPSIPALMTIPLALAVHRSGGGWYLPANGITSFAGNGGPQWGIQGRLQHPSLAPGEVESGSQAANQTNGTELWNGGRVPVRVSVSFPASPIVATTPALVDVTVTTLTGAPIPGVALFLRDTLNGSFPLPTVSTGSTGSATGLLDTPNVSAASLDLVTASVTLFGYNGSGASGLPLSPSLEVLITVQPSAPRVSPNDQTSLTFQTRNATGAPDPGILLTFQAGAATTLSQTYGTTDSGGVLTIMFTAPPTAADLVLTALVESVGHWGRLSVPIHVGAVSSGWSLPPTPELVEVGVLGLAAGLVLLAVVRHRRGRKALPEMPLRRYLKETRPGGPAPPAAPPGPGSQP
ncbi:MAG: hypothetical protein L3K19_02015, partial [Thermoplasmata archaeon]|nr:hypothetical protein [Thermoplasmata archaeon]